jgi:hypothetical protein
MQEPRARPATAVALIIAPQGCFWCFGSGRSPNDQHERYDRCEVCGGTGVRPTSPAIRLHGRPAIEVVAEAA